MTPTPLPTEEIAALAAHAKFWPSIYLSSEKLAALLAEIESLRQDASERDHFMRLAFVDLGTNKETWKERAEKAEAEIDAGRAGAERVREDLQFAEARVKSLEIELAALRQAAQPAGRVEPFTERELVELEEALECRKGGSPASQRVISAAFRKIGVALNRPWATPPVSGAVGDGKIGR